MKRQAARPVALLLALAATRAQGARAQAAYEIEVYGSQLTPPGALMLELQGNYIFRGASAAPTCATGPVVDDQLHRSLAAAAAACSSTNPPYLGVDRPAGSPAFAVKPYSPRDTTVAHPAHGTIEAVFGLTGTTEAAVYLFTARAWDGMRYAGASARLRAGLAASRHWPVHLALAVEAEHETAAVSANTWTLEIRPILDRAWGRWYVAVNPTLARVLRGPGSGSGVLFSPSGRVSFDAWRTVTAGIEYYGSMGPLSGFAPAARQLHELFGAIDLHAWRMWEVNAGLGFGLTPATDGLTAKLIVGRQIALH